MILSATEANTVLVTNIAHNVFFKVCYLRYTFIFFFIQQVFLKYLLCAWTIFVCILKVLSEKAMAPHSSTLAWKIPWTEEPGGLQSMGSLRVGQGWATSLSRIGEGNGNPLQCSCLENLRDRGAWWAAIYGVTQSRTRLKRLSSSSSKGLIA